MDILNSLKQDAQKVKTKLEETAKPQASVAPELPVEPVEPEVSVESKPEIKEPVTPDRSAYNCPTCKGEGLVADSFVEGGFVRCPQCNGTGKVN